MMEAFIRNHPALLAALVAGFSVMGAFGLSCLAGSMPADPPFELASAENGRRLFVQSCAHCHGDDARGNGEDADGPDLFALRIGNARIAAVIRTGIPHEMPSFAKKHGPAEISDLTAYLRNLR